MNRTFKTIFSKTLGANVVCGEHAKSHGKKSLKAVVAVAMMAGALGVAGNAVADTVSGDVKYDARVHVQDGAERIYQGDVTFESSSAVYGAFLANNSDAPKSGGRIIFNGKNLAVKVGSDSDPNYAAALFAQSRTANPDGRPNDRATIIINSDAVITATSSKKLGVDGVKDAHSFGLVAMSNSYIEANGNLDITAEDAVLARGYSKVLINKANDAAKTVKLNGNVDYNFNDVNSNSTVDSEVVINLANADSYWTGRTIVTSDNAGIVERSEQFPFDVAENTPGITVGLSEGGTWNVTGNTFVNTLNMADGGVVNDQNEDEAGSTVDVDTLNATGEGNALNGGAYNVEDAKVSNGSLSLNDGASLDAEKMTADNATINLNDSESSVDVGTMSGSATVNMATTSKGDDTFEHGTFAADEASGAALTVNYTGITADDVNNAQKAMQNLSEGVQAAGATVTNNVAEGDVAGAMTWTSVADSDANGGVSITGVTEQKNSTLSALMNIASNNYLVFRSQMNDLDKRMGDLRSMPNSDGAWARVIAGQSEYKGIHNTYQTLQIGADHRIGNFVVGGTASYSDGDGTLGHNGSTDDKNYTFGIYGSWLGDDGQFVDVIVKRAHLETDYDLRSDAGLKSKGSYHTEGTSISAEYGWRLGIEGTNYYVEPQVEFMYGHLDSTSYKTNRGVKVNQDAVKSAVGRLGVAAGWVSPDKTGSVYVKASVLNDWEGDADIKASKNGVSRKYHEDMGGTWVEYALGGTYNLSKNLSIYGEAETTSGNPVRTTYQVSAGMRYSF